MYQDTTQKNKDAEYGLARWIFFLLQANIIYQSYVKYKENVNKNALLAHNIKWTVEAAQIPFLSAGIF